VIRAATDATVARIRSLVKNAGGPLT
jgi:hypothetical protein